MVTVKDYKRREGKDGKEFFVLVLQGNVEPVKSMNTGRLYFTAKTCTVSSTFDEETCKSLIGMQFPGKIVKVETDPYDFKIPETGENIILKHRWEYQDSVEETIEETIEDAAIY